VPAPSADEVRRGADEILSRPEFQEPARSLYERVLDWIGARIADALGAFLGGGAGAVVAWVVLVALVLAVAYLVARALQRDRRVARGDGDGVAVETDVRRAPADWEAEAARHEAEGRWRDALRCRYRALVAGLARRGVVDEVPGRTSGEYRLLVGRARPQAAEPFAGATDLFERAWYGGEDPGPDAASDFRALAGAVESAAASAPSS
jgi:hypothetical protein